MQTYIILSKFGRSTPLEHGEFKEVVEKIKHRIRETCPSIEWRESYVTLGVYDVVDVVSAPDPNEVKKATMIIRKYGGSEIQTMVTTPWERFMEAL